MACAAILIAATFAVAGHGLGSVVHLFLSLALVTPLGPYIYRLAFQPIASASILTLLIAAVGVHLAFDAVAGPGLVKQGQRALRERVEPGTGTAIARLPLVAGERFRVMQRQAAMHA